MMRVYVSGPMTGLPQLNYPAFAEAAALLRARGFEVVSPAELPHPPRASWEECLRLDLAALLTCEAVFVLPGWRRSKGALLELDVATSIGLPVFGRSDLIGLRKETSLSTLTTKSSSKLAVTSVSGHAHDTSANRHFSGLLGPVTSSVPDADHVSAASRSAEESQPHRTEQLADGERFVEGEPFYSADWLAGEDVPERRLRLVQ